MRILLCNYEYPPIGGGGGVITALLAEELATRHEVTVLTSRMLGLPGFSQEHGVRIIRAPVPFRRIRAAANMASMFAYLPSGILEGRKLLSRESFDVINAHFAGTYFSDRPELPQEVAMAGSPAQCAAKIREYQDAGLTRFILDFQMHGVASPAESMAQMTLFREHVVPLL